MYSRAHIITAPRKILPTPLATVNPNHSGNSSVFSPKPLPDSASTIPRSVWATPPEVLRKNLIEGRKKSIMSDVSNADNSKKKPSQRLQTTVVSSKHQTAQDPPWDGGKGFKHKGAAETAKTPSDMPRRVALTSLTQDFTPANSPFAVAAKNE